MILRRFVGGWIAALITLASPAVASQAKAPPGAERTAAWNAETSDLEPDPSILYGKLANGLRYAIRPNHRPQNQVAVRMAVDFGSAAEAEGEQGLAHFIEHMAFNGSTNVPEGEMVRMLERLGLSFGADTNASTGYVQTQYKLDLPKAEPALIAQSLFLMRETASELLFNPAAVDRERGVVIAEMREKENYGMQSMRAANALFYPGTFYSTRYPIGKLEILKNAPAERMKALYQKWYRPDRITLVVVGPVNPVEIEKQIVAKFADWHNDEHDLGDIDRCQIDTGRGLIAESFTHPEISEAISVQQIVPDRARPDTVERAMIELKMQIASQIVTQRMSRRSRDGDVPSLGGGLTFGIGFCDRYARIGFNMSGKDGSWRELLPFTEQIVRQAVEFGFSDAEISEQVRRYDSAYQNAAKDEATKASGAIANDLVTLDDDVLNSAAYRQLLWIQLRPFMTRNSINAEFAKWFGQLDTPMLFLTTKTAEGFAARHLTEAYLASRSQAVTAPSAREQSVFAYTDLGNPGSVVEDKIISDLGIHTIRFANGVLLNLKKTDFEDNRIRFSLRIDGGELFFGKENAPLARLMAAAYVSGGLEAHDVEDLRSLLAGTTVSASFSVADDYFGSSGAVAPADLERQLQVIAAYIQHPAYRENALRLFRRPLPEAYARLDSTPGSALGIASARIMTDNDPRFAFPSLETMQSVDFGMLKNALGNALIENRLEIALVGDFDENAAIATVARTLGALPTRKNTPTVYADARKTQWTQAAGTFDIPHRGESNQLSWRRIWTTTDDSDQRTAQSMDLLARIVTLRLTDELREKLGATYGAGASSTMSSVYPGRGTFAIATTADPKDIAVIESTVDRIVAEMVSAPVSNDIFERARKPVLESYADWRKRNDTWLSVLSVAQSDPARVERFRQSEDLFKSLTEKDIWNAAKMWLGKPAQFTFRALPQDHVTETMK
jgi:zinc protease